MEGLLYFLFFVIVKVDSHQIRDNFFSSSFNEVQAYIDRRRQFTITWCYDIDITQNCE